MTNPNKQISGKKGGLSTLKKYGKEHMREIAKKKKILSITNEEDDR